MMNSIMPESLANYLPRFFDYSTELSYSKTERVTCIEDIQHPAIRNAMKMLDMHEIRLTYEADLPARSGLGTSSSFAVGMLNAFYALKGRYKGYEGERPELKIECDCRKPKPGMLLNAAADFNIDLSQSWMVGDGENDVKAGLNAGCKTALIGQDKENIGQLVSEISLLGFVKNNLQ